MEDNANTRIIFFTSYQPKNKRERNKLDKSMRDYFGKYDLEMNFRSDTITENCAQIMIKSLCKINYGVFSYDTIAGMLNNVDDLKIAIRNMGNIEKLISVKLQNEEEIFMEIFSAIGDEVLGY